MLQMVAGRKYSAKLRCLTAVIFDPVTEIMSSLPRCNHQTISEIWSKCTMHRLLKLIQLVLENNHFRFNKDNYIQKIGTAMGSPMAPAYASLFMGKHKQEFLESRDLVPSVWLRFLDDIFMV